MAKNCSFWFSPKGLAALGLIGAASYFLLMEHREHVVQWLPFLILLLCPLMHLFMHHGHSHRSSGKERMHQPSGEEDEAYRRGYDAGQKETYDDRER
jgi:hypothetical protein